MKNSNKTQYNLTIWLIGPKSRWFYLLIFAVISVVYCQIVACDNQQQNKNHATPQQSDINSNFIDVMEERIANQDFNCNDFEPVKKYSCLSYQSAKGINNNSASNKFKIFYAIEAMNITQNIVSSSRYLLIHATMKENFEVPGRDAENCLTEGYGICGNHEPVFSALLNQIGIKSRPVQFFYYTKDGMRASHIAVEALIGNKWRFFDSTWGGFFIEKSSKSLIIASIADVIARPDSYRLIANAAQTWTFKSSRRYNVFEYVNPNSSIVYGFDDGNIKIRDIDESAGTINLQHIPNYVGDNRENGNFKGVKYSFTPLKGRYTFHLNISGVRGCNDNQSTLCINNNCVAINKIAKNATIDIDVLNPEEIFIFTKDNVCYTVFNKILFTKQKQ